jgi:hypothetical protein
MSDPGPKPNGHPVAEPLLRVAYRLADVVLVTGLPRRVIERERAAGRFPKPDRIVSKRIPIWARETIERARLNQARAAALRALPPAADSKRRNSCEMDLPLGRPPGFARFPGLKRCSIGGTKPLIGDGRLLAGSAAIPFSMGTLRFQPVGARFTTWTTRAARGPGAHLQITC